jgi:hypothetical protein
VKRAAPMLIDSVGIRSRFQQQLYQLEIVQESYVFEACLQFIFCWPAFVLIFHQFSRYSFL